MSKEKKNKTNIMYERLTLINTAFTKHIFTFIPVILSK